MKEMRTMVSPPPGFTSRVMARVQIHRQSQARRRAVIGFGFLAIAAVGLVALAGLYLASQFDEFVSFPSSVASFLFLAVSLVDVAFTLLDALWLSITTVLSSINIVVLIVYACAVTTFTVLWLRIAFGHFQYPLVNLFTED